MARAVSGTVSKKRHKKFLKLAKGYTAANSRTFRRAHEVVTRALKYAFRDRRKLKREFRGLWIVRINAAARTEGISYSEMIGGLAKANVRLDRRMIAELAVNNIDVFRELAAIAKKHLPAVKTATA